MSVIELNNVSVRYRKQNSRATADIFKRLLRKQPRSGEFWALRNISFTLEKGDMLGVIGKNGAGKSTLMKAISGTLTPAVGSIKREGKLCALLELSSGFDREMTVRENIYLRGALLGYSREFIDSKYDEIIDFADMREFEDNPFRTLSSGMKSRIAFSIASLVEPDIIILDEVFAVGDGDFKKKSQRRMQDIIGSGETTALMVSHSMSAVLEQCNKVLWLDRGRMVMFGEPEPIVREYKKYLETGKLPQTELLKSTQKNPASTAAPRRKSRKRGIVLMYTALLLFALAGGFLWAQNDLVKACFDARGSDASELIAEADAAHSEIYELLNVDTSGWDETLFEESADAILNDEMSFSDAAHMVLEAAGEEAEDDRLALELAKLEAVRAVQLESLDRLIEQTRAELPDGKCSPAAAYFAGVGDFFSFEKDCDDELDDMLTDLRKLLRKNDLDETLADRIQRIYDDEKQILKAYCIASLGEPKPAA